MDGTTVEGWLVERAISTDGKVHAWAVSRDGRQAIMHVVAPGASSTLLYAATAQRELVVRGRHEGNAYVITTDQPRPVKRKSRTLAVVALGVLVLAAGAVAVVMLRGGERATHCRDCVLEVNGVEVSSAAFRMYVSDPYLFPDRKGDDKKHAALDLLVMRALLHAGATETAPADLAERAARGEYVIGLERLDLRTKLVEAGDPFNGGTVERFAKSLGFPTKQALYEEMRIEYVALAARERVAPDLQQWFVAACVKATIVVDNSVQRVLAVPYRPCTKR